MKFTLGKQTGKKHMDSVQKINPKFATKLERAQKKLEDTSSKFSREITKKRNRNSKFYVNKNGTLTAIYSGKPIHYLDTLDNSFKDIDNSLLDTGDGLETRAGSFKARFAKRSGDGKIFELEKSGCKVGLISCDAAERGGCQLETCTCSEGNSKEASKVVLKNVKNNIDIEYVVDSEKIKENIIIKEKAASYEFDFDLSIGDLIVGVSQDGKKLELKAKQTGKVQFCIPAPFMTDSNSGYSDSVYYEIVQAEQGLLSLKVIADNEWINAEDRVLPVTIDPQIFVFDYIGNYYYDEEFDANIFRFRQTDNTGNSLPATELRTFYNSNSGEYIESTLIIPKDKLNPSMLHNIIEGRLTLQIDLSRSTIKNFSIDGINFWDHPSQFVTLDISGSLRFNDGGDIEIPFRPPYERLGCVDSNVYFFPPTLEIECGDFVTSLEVVQPPLKRNYWAGEHFEEEGMMLEATYYSEEVVPTVAFTITQPKTLATYDQSVTISYDGFSMPYPINVYQGGFNDRRPVANKENVYRMITVDQNTGDPVVGENIKYVRLELYDGAQGNDVGTPLNAKHLNNVLVRAENIRGIIDEENLPEFLRELK